MERSLNIVTAHHLHKDVIDHGHAEVTLTVTSTGARAHCKDCTFEDVLALFSKPELREARRAAGLSAVPEMSGERPRRIVVEVI